MADNPEGEEVPNSTISNAGHPLVNHLVVSKIFEGAKLSELRTLRLVCKDWHFVCLPIWRRTAQVIIHDHDDDESSNQRLLQWKSLGTELDAAGEKPFRNFRLHLPQFLAPNSKPYSRWCFRTEMHENLEKYRNMEQFWVNYGHWIHKLELKEVYVTDVKAFKRAILEQTPNLQELTLDELRDGRDRRGTNSSDPLPVQANLDENEGRGTVQVQPNLNLRVLSLKNGTQLPFGWMLLFNRFPNIEKVELAERMKSVVEFVDSVKTMLTNPARHPNLPITDLRLEDFVPRRVKRLLQMPQLKLKVLHLSSCRNEHDDDDNDLDVLRTAMQLHGNTLKELHLEDVVKSADFWESVGVTYVSLTELQMKGSSVPFSFHFLQKLPNLKVLRVEQEGNAEMLWNTDWAALERMPNLQEFYFIVTSSSAFFPEEILDRFAALMPNLESITGQFDNLMLRVVCRNWRKLKKLVILSGWCLDGVDPTDPPLGAIVDIDDVGITGIVPGSDERVPCVADLQELRHLTLEHVTLIGDASVSEGFLKLPHLTSLDICDTNEIWGEELDALRRRLQGGLTISPMCP